MRPIFLSDDGDVSSFASSSKSLTPRHVLYVDAYDSFSYNIVSMLEENLMVEVALITVDSEWPDGDMVGFLRNFDAIVLGPGPGDPNNSSDVGIMRDIWSLSQENVLPVLGICLGFQSLCLHHGVPVQRLPYPLHGQVRHISISNDIIEGIQDFEVTLYHSLYAKFNTAKEGFHKFSEREFYRQKDQNVLSQEDDLLVFAWLQLDDPELGGSTPIPMGVRHKEKPFWGLQFHPESCKSNKRACKELLRRWWKMAVEFNERSNRLITASSLDFIDKPPLILNAALEITLLMEELSAASSNRCAFRTLPLHDLTVEIIYEMMNTSSSASVLFQSNGRHTIISIPSPNSWRLEYFVPSRRLSLMDLGVCMADGTSKECTRQIASSILPIHQLWDVLRCLTEKRKVSAGVSDIPFWGGFLGYFSYEMGLSGLSHPKSTVEVSCKYPNSSGRSPTSGKVSKEDPPDVSLLWVERSIVIDSKTRQIYIQSTRESDDTLGGWLDLTLQRFQGLMDTGFSEPKLCRSPTKTGTAGEESMDSIFNKAVIKMPDEDSYKRQVEACKALLEAGESYELCLTCEISITLPMEGINNVRDKRPWQLFKRLRKYNPAAFSAYARLGKVKIVSSSPECFLNWDRYSTLEMKPMKGTVRKSAEMTLEKAKAILSTTKEMAENLMIADLVRHDLYGICGSGRVQVEKLLQVEDHGHVFQMITHIKGVIDHRHRGSRVSHMPYLKTPNMSVHGITALQRCLPPGSMTGAPKERSCLHLESIEGRKRGIYSGVMGYIDLGGGGSFSVLIRTLFTCSDDNAEQQVWRVGAGGAVTTLSTAAGEWDEMLTKLRTVVNIFDASNSS
ncbi:hypothetical protein Egran_05097 [Elaphomyces granulatus]|uniref:aminodeoxychorismate synthase n=1 Tax=Elaphomyces granulatus TaxID=519963 RepID=A0A232LSZ6_9EURO|nr:hypothetical protein Egran_05097 [Elaphomyces granulatus]